MNLIKILFILSILSATLYMNFSGFRIISFILLIIIVVITLLLKPTLRFKFDILMLLLIIVLLICGLFSSFVNQDIALLFGILSLVSTFAILILFIPNIFNYYKDYILINSLFIVNLPLVVFSILITGVFNPSGIFNNPNSYGIILVLLLAGVCSSLYHILEKNILDKNKSTVLKLTFSFLMITTLFLLIIQTNSRTSFLISILIIVFMSILLVKVFISKMSYNSIRKMVYTVTFLLLLGGLVSIIFPIKELFMENIYFKFVLRSTQGDLLSGRDVVWEWVISNINLFGHGRDVFSQFNIGAHNTFISMLAQYGFLVSIIFILILMIGILASFKFYVNNPLKRHNILPLLLITTFIMQSFSEGMLYKSSMYYALISIGFVVYENKRSKGEDK